LVVVSRKLLFAAVLVLGILCLFTLHAEDLLNYSGGTHRITSGSSSDPAAAKKEQGKYSVSSIPDFEYDLRGKSFTSDNIKKALAPLHLKDPAVSVTGGEIYAAYILPYYKSEEELLKNTAVNAYYIFRQGYRHYKTKKIRIAVRSIFLEGGKESMDTAVILTMYKSTGEQIHWGKFRTMFEEDYTMLYRVVTCSFHPALLENIPAETRERLL